VWPWKAQIDTVNNKTWAWSLEKFNDHTITLAEKNYLPQTFEQVTGADAHLVGGITAAALAIVIFLTIETIGNRMGSKK